MDGNFLLSLPAEISILFDRAEIKGIVRGGEESTQSEISVEEGYTGPIEFSEEEFEETGTPSNITVGISEPGAEIKFPPDFLKRSKRGDLPSESERSNRYIVPSKSKSFEDRVIFESPTEYANTVRAEYQANQSQFFKEFELFHGKAQVIVIE